MDVFNIGKKNSGPTFWTLQQAPGAWGVSAACETNGLEAEAAEPLGRQKSSQRPGRFSTEKTSYPASIYINRFLVGFQVLPEQHSQ